MSDKQKAVDDIQKLGRMFKGIIALGEDLAKLASVEQAVQEVKGRLEKYNAEEAAVLHKYAEFEKNAQDVVKKCEAQWTEALAKSEKEIADAKILAESILVEAQTMAGKIVSAAEADGTAVRDAAMKVNEQKAKIEAEIVLAQKKLDELNAKIEALKAKFV